MPTVKEVVMANNYSLSGKYAIVTGSISAQNLTIGWTGTSAPHGARFPR